MSSVSDQQWLRQIGVDLDAVDPDIEREVVEDRGGILDAWAGEQNGVDDATAGSDDPDHGDDIDAADVVDLDPVSGDGAGAAEPNETLSEPTDVTAEPQQTRRFTPWVLGVFVVVVVLATLVTTVGVTMSGPDDAPRAHPHPAKGTVPTVAAAPTPASAEPGGDHPLPFTAAADCPPGASTSANSIADPDKPSPWICVRHTDGQPLYITLGPAGIERSYVITAVSIVPGDTAPAQGSGADPWLQHRVVTLVQWQFNDTAHTVVDQDTGNVHGEAVKPIPAISASKITVIIRQTSRPVAPTQSSPPTPDAGPFGGILGGPAPAGGPDPTGSGAGSSGDPSDGTFAVSSIKVIGHKAL
ncbi:hypothetical protein [Mycobacterium kansasii]|uniref:hypothetical protein n=1 Tax=Mycobacterium kansasii TaxID=1768 RepID=UPI0004D53385|nr:hypothetical protein [Mycobacterium kansasii]KEP38799.1 hypothetical protein MKSMC1_60890 [Mycobacterium kansasii]